MADIFMSYARDDRSKAELLAKTFQGRNWSVWWETRLKAGEVWDEGIERELNAARCVVVLWSKMSVDRQFVRVEAYDGLQRHILVPVLIEDVRPPLAFRLVQTEQLLDWSGESSHAGLNRLLAAISERLQPQPQRVDPRLPPDLVEGLVKAGLRLVYGRDLPELVEGSLGTQTPDKALQTTKKRQGRSKG